ncbi:hypothetical protein KO495_03715 [Colwellia sp. D2M02]|uniref:hypothetical protein n=1 Tax=Colwellia sp. D2M02 TaxID=2841562 RepID=UPI001C099B5A|nr:hypothetical protein [Colwellia sp. D2M02]MBU2892430.1 hypothetical protein [Colwellia sp. D2M02]
MMLISSSSFFLSPYLTKKIMQGEANHKQFNFALQRNNTAALALEINKHREGSSQWLFFKMALAHQQAQTAYELATWYDNQYLNVIAEQRLSSKYLQEAKKWYQQAIRLGSEIAKVSFARLYQQQGRLNLARSQLSQVNSSAGLDIELGSLLVSIDLALETGNIKLVESLIVQKIPLLLLTPEGRKLLADIQRYKTLNVGSHVSEKVANLFTSVATPTMARSLLQPPNTSCTTSLQLFASSLANLKHLDALIEQFISTPLASFVCLPPPRYVARQSLSCHNNKKSALLCDESTWRELAATITTRHIGYMSNEGGANVHFGILYFDRHDSVDVFTHELSHLLGFIDEYPLSTNHSTCQQTQASKFSHNLSVLARNYQGRQADIRRQILQELPWSNAIKPSTPILHQRDHNSDNWLLGTPKSHRHEVGVFAAQSCKKSKLAKANNFSAFKATAQSTHLEYSVEQLSLLYLQQLNLAPEKFLMPSFHYNIALALYQQGEEEQALYWLEQAKLW